MPPVLLGVVPDSGAVVEGFEDDLIFEFDEVITEQNLAQLIRVSPRHEEIRVRWRRQRVAIKPADGWHPNATYQVSILAGLTDLRTNRTDTARTVVFSTGGPIPQTAITGAVVDWEAHRLAPRALIEVIRPADSLIYTGVADSVGNFSLQAIPPGDYVLVGVLDQNTNDRRDRREAFDSTIIRVEPDTAIGPFSLWAFPRDTIGPRIQTATLIDSLAVSLQFTQSLDTMPPLPTDVVVRQLPDSTPVAVAGVYWRATYDSVVAAVRDSLAQIAADSVQAVADSIAAAQDTIPPDSAQVAQPADTVVAAEPPPDLPVELAPDSSEAADSVTVNPILLERPEVTKTIVVMMAEPLQPDTRYVFEATLASLLGIRETSLRMVIVPPAPEPEPQ